MVKRSFEIGGFTLIFIVLIIMGMLDSYVIRTNPKLKEKAVVVEINRSGSRTSKNDKVKFLDGVVVAIDIDNIYEVGDTILVERK